MNSKTDREEKPVSEWSSYYSELETKSVQDLLQYINTEDQKVAYVVEQIIPEIATLVEKIVKRVLKGGRLFYIGAGTSGRLGIVDASECPPTFGVPAGLVIGLIAGGDRAIRTAVEFAEDDEDQGWKDLQSHAIGPLDTLLGIAASGSTPYVVGAVKKARKNGILTACISVNPNSKLVYESEYPLVAPVGPEMITGSSRMKAGTAQKMILNMISTSLMIKIGRVQGNRMVDMQLSNHKLVHRGTQMIMDSLEISFEKANKLLLKHGSVRKAIDAQQD